MEQWGMFEKKTPFSNKLFQGDGNEFGFWGPEMNVCDPRMLKDSHLWPRESLGWNQELSINLSICMGALFFQTFLLLLLAAFYRKCFQFVSITLGQLKYLERLC